MGISPFRVRIGRKAGFCSRRAKTAAPLGSGASFRAQFVGYCETSPAASRCQALLGKIWGGKPPFVQIAESIPPARHAFRANRGRIESNRAPRRTTRFAKARKLRLSASAFGGYHMATPINYIQGTPGDDDLSGTAGKDYFELQQGGNDNVQGLDGDDVFAFRNSLTAADTVDGGTGNDAILIAGDSYADGLTFGADTLTSVEKLQVGAGHAYNLTTVDANVAAGARLLVDAVSLQSNDTLIFNGSAESDGSFKFIGGAGSNEFTGGANQDVF